MEDNVMLTNTNMEFFPVFNNEFSIGYGLNDFLVIGLFYDLYHVSRFHNSVYFKGNKHLGGIKTAFSILPLISNHYLQKKLSNVNLNVNGYFSYNSNDSYFIYEEKKDMQTWVNYYRINLQYFVTPKFYLSTSAGIINTNRIMFGVGVKL